MENPKITIITATHNLIAANRTHTFEQCVESVAMQDYDNYEHIVIDGASTDGTVGLLQKYADSGAITFISEKDTGIFQAFNRGIKKATGKYIAFLNSDDFYTRKDAFSLVSQKMELEDGDFSYAPFNVVDINGKFLEEWQASLNKLPIRISIAHATMFTKKNVFEKIGFFDEQFRIAADFDLILRAFLAGCRPCHIKENFVAFRKGGVSDTEKMVCHFENLKVLNKNYDFDPMDLKKYDTYEYLPLNVLENMLKNIHPSIDKNAIFSAHKYRYYKYLKRQLFTLRWSKRRKTIRLFGLTFYNNEVY